MRAIVFRHSWFAVVALALSFVAVPPVSAEKKWGGGSKMPEVEIVEESDGGCPVTKPEETSGAYLTGLTRAGMVPKVGLDVLRQGYLRRGTKVGDGECAALPVAVLQAAGAKGMQGTGPQGDPIWGTHIATFTPGAIPSAKVFPGDVIQFYRARFEGKTATGTYWANAGNPHHSAIVRAAGKGADGGKVVLVLEQNVGSPAASEAERKQVQWGSYRMTDLKQGWVKVYRPIAAGGGTGTPRLLTGAVLLDNNYGGQVTIHLYHPANPDRVFATWVLAPSRETYLLLNDKRVIVGGDWGIDILFGNGVRSPRRTVEAVGNHGGNVWHVDASHIYQGR